MRYADDTALIAEPQEKLQALLNKVVEESEKKGMTINCKKTECMVIRKRKDVANCELNTGNNVIKKVRKFNYLGSLITEDGRSDMEIKRRIGIAKDTFMKMDEFLKDRKLSIETKIRV